jgi:hypothetical protein
MAGRRQLAKVAAQMFDDDTSASHWFLFTEIVHFHFARNVYLLKILCNVVQTSLLSTMVLMTQCI